MDRPGRPLSDAAFALIIPAESEVRPAGPATSRRPKAFARSDGFESVRGTSTTRADAESLPSGSSSQRMLLPVNLADVSHLSRSWDSGARETKEDSSPSSSPGSKSKATRLGFLSQTLRPLLPQRKEEARAQARPKAPPPLAPGLERQSSKGKRPPEPLMSLGSGDDYSPPASPASPKFEVLSPTKSNSGVFKREGADRPDTRSQARRLSSLCVRGWTQQVLKEEEARKEEEDESPGDRLLRMQETLKEALDLQARGHAIELKPLSSLEEKEMLELEALVEEHQLTGKAALAFMLVGKFGSLDTAFTYLDSAGHGEAFASVSWHTGMLILRIDTVKIAGLSKQQCFSAIASGSASVSKAAWDEYFANVEDALPSTTRKRGRRLATKPKLPVVATPRERPPEEKEKPEKPPTPEERKPRLEATKSKFRKAAMKAVTLSRLRKEEEEEEDEDTFRGRATKELSELSPDQSVKLSNLSRKKRAIYLQAAKDLGLWSSTQGSSLLVLCEGPIAAQLRQDIAEMPLATGQRIRVAKAGPGLVLLGRTLAEAAGLRMCKVSGELPAACTELVVPKFSSAARRLFGDLEDEEGYDVDIFNDQGAEAELVAAVEEQLKALDIDARFDYPAAAGQAFRSVVDKVCKRHVLEATGVQGFQERIVVGNLSRSINQLHENLTAVKGDGCVQFGNSISRLEKEVIRREARLKGYTIIEDETGMKVSRMSMLEVPKKEASVKDDLCLLHGQVFEKYATGRVGTQTYMRRNDLTEMLKDAPPGRGDALAVALQKAYDDTLHLQIEVTKASNGLSQRFFKVFLDAAMQQAGWYPSPEILQALQDKADAELE